jgi:hypothetical protein
MLTSANASTGAVRPWSLNGSGSSACRLVSWPDESTVETMTKRDQLGRIVALPQGVCRHSTGGGQPDICWRWPVICWRARAFSLVSSPRIARMLTDQSLSRL